MDVASILQDPELAFTNRNSRGSRRLPPDFAQGSKCLSELHPRTEPVPSGIVSMGRFPPGHRGIRESIKGYGRNQISSAHSFHLFGHRHHLIFQSPAPVGCGGGFYDLCSECLVRSLCNYRLFDHRTSPSGLHFPDRRNLVYGRPRADSARNSGRVSGGGLRRS